MLSLADQFIISPLNNYTSLLYFSQLDSSTGQIFAIMGDHDIESEGEKISSAPVSYSEKPTAETMEHSPITLTEEDVCCL